MSGLEVRVAAGSDSAVSVPVGDDPVAVRRDAAAWVRGRSADPVAVDASALAGDRLAAFAEGLVLGAYRFSRASSPADAPGSIDLCGAKDPDAVEQGLARGRAVAWARELANTRTNVKTPAWLGEYASDVLEPLGARVTVRDEAWLAEQGFGGVLAVGGGSASPPRLIEAAWRPRGAQRHMALVGKGITFDTGGLDRKVGAGMTTMYTDMSGGAAVLGALRIIAAERLPVRVTALVPAAENAFSGSAYRPGDIVRHHGGRTSEITNTDAEGRMVLADAIAYAAGRLRADTIVDIATLTGAAKVALGDRRGALFASTDELAADLLAAASSAGEPLWRLPLWADYAERIESPLADAVNSGGNPGAITAALFLQPFAATVPWAHLDVAGPARASKDDRDVSRGATGFGARLLAEWVRAQA